MVGYGCRERRRRTRGGRRKFTLSRRTLGSYGSRPRLSSKSGTSARGSSPTRSSTTTLFCCRGCTNTSKPPTIARPWTSSVASRRSPGSTSTSLASSSSAPRRQRQSTWMRWPHALTIQNAGRVPNRTSHKVWLQTFTFSGGWAKIAHFKGRPPRLPFSREADAFFGLVERPTLAYRRDRASSSM